MFFRKSRNFVQIAVSDNVRLNFLLIMYLSIEELIKGPSIQIEIMVYSIGVSFSITNPVNPFLYRSEI